MEKNKKRYVLIALLVLIIPFTTGKFVSSKENINFLNNNKNTQKIIDKKTKKFLFGEWRVKRLLGFTHVQNDYANFPYGHDIIGNKIIINEKHFSTKSLKNAPKYQAKINNPVYCKGYISKKSDFLIFPVNPYAKNKEIDKIIESDYFINIDIENSKLLSPVGLCISNNKKLILVLDCVFYELKKVQ